MLEPSHNWMENVHMMTDVLSKYTVSVPTCDQWASTVAQVLLREWFSNLDKLHSLWQMQELWELLNPPALFLVWGSIVSYYPMTSNGLIELSTTSSKPCQNLESGTELLFTAGALLLHSTTHEGAHELHDQLVHKATLEVVQLVYSTKGHNKIQNI